MKAAKQKPRWADNGLPYTYVVKGKHWYFRYRGILAPIGSDYGSERFMARYAELRAQIVGDDPDDKRLIYFIGWDGGPIKIGLADDIRVRLRTLQVACPYKLKVLAAVAGGLKREKSFHAQFAHRRLRGEWFERCAEIETAIHKVGGKPH